MASPNAIYIGDHYERHIGGGSYGLGYGLKHGARIAIRNTPSDNGHRGDRLRHREGSESVLLLEGRLRLTGEGEGCNDQYQGDDAQLKCERLCEQPSEPGKPHSQTVTAPLADVS